MTHVSKMEADSRVAAGVHPAATMASAESESNLVVRAQGGDQSAYEDLIRIHQPRLLAVVGRILRRAEDVEDVAQQALLKAYLSLKRFDQRSAFGTWLYKIAVNECRDYFRKKKVRPLAYEADLSEDQLRQLESMPDGRSGISPLAGGDAAKQTERRDMLERLLGELDETDRIMLMMKEVEGFTVEEIGEVLELNVNTVKVRLFRARIKLVEVYRRRLKGQKPTRSPRP